MSYTVKFQTEEAYKDISYGGNSIYNSACGPASLCNALKAAGIADVSVPTMCQFAVGCGARVDGGTDEITLLNAASKKYNFTWKATSLNADLLAHLKKGGVAIINNGDSYPLFSSGGHFVAAVHASGQTITVLDSYWYDGKYTSTTLRANNVEVVGRGIVKTSLIQCGEASMDRDPSYYLISKPSRKTSKAPEFAEGKTYKTLTTLKLRETASKKAKIKKRADMSDYTKTQCTKSAKATLKRGVEITCKAVETGEDGSVFVRTSSGWLLAWNHKSTYQNIG